IKLSRSSLDVRLNSPIRGADGVWIPDNNDHIVHLVDATSIVTDLVTIPLTTTAGAYDAAWVIYSKDHKVIYDSQIQLGAITVSIPTPTATSTVRSTPTSTFTRPPAATNTATRTATRTQTTT